MGISVLFRLPPRSICSFTSFLLKMHFPKLLLIIILLRVRMQTWSIECLRKFTSQPVLKHRQLCAKTTSKQLNPCNHTAILSACLYMLPIL